MLTLRSFSIDGRLRGGGQEWQVTLELADDEIDIEGINAPLDRWYAKTSARSELVVTLADGDLEAIFISSGRPTLVKVFDVARGGLDYYVVYEGDRYMTIVETLYRTVWPKVDAQGRGVKERYGTLHDWPVCGVPFSLMVDNGEAFIGMDLKDACYELGINLVIRPVCSPHLKGHIERSFGALTRYLNSLGEG